MAEGGAAIKVEKAVESSTETLAVPGEAESGVSNDERALLNKLKRLKKRSLSSAKLNCWEAGDIKDIKDFGRPWRCEGSRGQ